MTTPPPAGDSEALAELIRQHPMCNEEETYNSDTIVPWWRCLARDITAAGFTRGRSDETVADVLERHVAMIDEARAKHALYVTMAAQTERDLRDTIKRLERERDGLHRRIAALSDEIGGYERQVRTLTRERDGAINQAEHNLDLRDALARHHETIRAERDGLAKKLAERDGDVRRLEAAVVANAGKPEAGNGALHLIAHIHARANERDAAISERDEARAERDHWKANHDNAIAIRRAVLSRPDLSMRIHPERDEFTATLRAAVARADAAEKDRDRWRDDVSKQAVQLHQARERADAAEAKLAEANQTLAVEVKHCLGWRDAYVETQAKLAEAEREIARAHGAHAMLAAAEQRAAKLADVMTDAANRLRLAAMATRLTTGPDATESLMGSVANRLCAALAAAAPAAAKGT